MRRLPAFALCAAMFLISVSALAQSFPDDRDLGDFPGPVTFSAGRAAFSVRGVVRDAATNLPLSNARVDLARLSGPSIGTSFTGNNGTFSFLDLSNGSYVVNVIFNGYEPFSERVDIENAPVPSVSAMLHKVGETNSPPPGSGPTVSARELGIPGKAREAMDKGMRLLYMKSDFAGSIREFQRAIQAYPKFYEAYAEMATAYLGMKDTAHAEEALHKSLDLSDQQYPQALVMQASLFSDAHRFADAEPLARKAAGLDVNSWQADAELGRALLGQDMAAEAEKYLHAAIKIEPNYAVLYLLLFNTHVKLQNYSALLQDADQYLKLAPSGSSSDQIRTIRDKVQKMLDDEQTNPAQSPASESQPQIAH